ncbi:MAG: glycosyltransferase family 4 protein [Alphaproteobacteria bacterium]
MENVSMRILFVWRKYDRVVGGVERMSIALMNEMAKRGHDIFLLSWDRADAVSYYEMDPRIDWKKLDEGDSNVRAGWGLRLRRALKIRKIVKKIQPDIILAFMDGVFLSVRVSVMGLGIPVAEAERCSAARFQFLSSKRYAGLIFQSLRLAKKITIQMESYKKDYPEYLHGRIVSIPNPVFQSTVQAYPEGEKGNKKYILSVGRLSYQKNYQVLLKAFAFLKNDFPEWYLRIIGEGESEADLKKMTLDLGIESHVEFLGATKNVSAAYSAAHIFCLPSLWEGFPNALAEALAHGLPAVGFSDCLGVCDLIGNENGILAKGKDDENSLAKALRRLMEDDTLRAEIGKKAKKSMQTYSPEEIFNRWEQFFIKAIG